MPLRSLTYDEFESLASRVAKKEGISLSKPVLNELVSSSQGSARTLLVLLDKVANLDEEQRVEAIQARLAEENEGIDLCRALLKREQWPRIAGILKNLKSDPESVRWAVLGYAKSVLMNGKADWQAFNVIDIFSKNFYDSKDAGLAAACFEAVTAK
jgi:DNA polymerase III gamma/tau subunit